ncbi:histidinol dehydrogenase, partial [Pseudomonas fluorescens]
MTSQVKRLKSSQADFDQQLDAMLAWESVSDKAVNERVDDIIAQVRAMGDEEVVELTNRFDRTSV